MAAGVINLQKESGGIVKISPADGTGVTELVVPESGNLVSVNTTVTDNAIARYDGTTGKLQNSGVVIDDSGNVGIGVAPSAWYGGRTRAIEIGDTPDNGTIWPSLTHQHSHIGIGANFYMDSSFTPRYKNNYSASQYQQELGSHSWFIAPAGTAGNTITWTNAMTLGANGNLLVGTSTDNGVDKLQVNGSMSDVDISRKVEAGFTTTIGTGQTYIANLQDLVQSNGLSSGVYLVTISMNGDAARYWNSEHTFVTHIPTGGGSIYNNCPANVMKSNSWYHHRAASEHIFYTDSNNEGSYYGQLSLYCSAAVSYPESGVVRIKRLLNN